MSALRHYAREIESLWSTQLERPVILGERDWELIEDWHRREIPLTLIQEAIEGWTPKRSRRAPGLHRIAPAIEEGWRTILEGRLEPTTVAAAEPATGLAQRWEAWAAERPEGDPIAGLLRDILKQPASDAERLQQLEERLIDLLPPENRKQVEKRVERELARYAARMDSATLETTRRAALGRAARQTLGIPNR